MSVRKSDIIWNFIGTVLSLSSNFILLPFLLFFLDTDTIGLWNVFLSIGAIVVLFDFGFNPTLARNIAYSWKGAKQLYKVDSDITTSEEPNYDLMKEIIKTTKLIYLVISILALVVLLTVGTFYVISISSTIEENYYLYAWIIYCVAVFMNLYFGYFTTFLRGVGAIRETNISVILSRVLQILITIFLLFLGFDIMSVAVGYLIYGFSFRLISKRYFYTYKNIGKTLKQIKDKIDLCNIKRTFTIIWHNAWRDGLVYLSMYLTSQASILIASSFLTLTETGVFSITMQLATAIAAISGSLYSVYQPSMQFLYISRDFKKLKELMSISMFIYIIFFVLGTIAIYFVGLPLIYIIKSDFVFNLNIFWMVFAYIFLLKHHSYYASFISNTNNVPYVKSYLVSSFTGIIFSILLVTFFDLGIIGLVLGQIMAQAVYNNWKWPLAVYNILNTSFLKMFIEGFVKTYRLLALIFKKIIKV